MRVRRAAMKVTTIMALTGILVFGWTLESHFDPGRPLSRAKDQVIRDAVVVIPRAHAHVGIRTTTPRTVAPAILGRLSRKTCRNGNPVSVLRTLLTASGLLIM